MSVYSPFSKLRMKIICPVRATSFLVAVCFCMVTFAAKAQIRKFDIFTYKVPSNFKFKDSVNKVFYESVEGSKYCQLYIFPALQGAQDIEKNFAMDWESYAAKPFNIAAPEPDTKNKTENGDTKQMFGAARGKYNNIQFIVTVTTYTKGSITWCVATVFNDKKYLEVAQQFSDNIKANTDLFASGGAGSGQLVNTAAVTNGKGNSGLTMATTNFDDGWKATPTKDYVLVTRAGIQARLYYINQPLDDQRPNTIDAPEWYWSKIVELGFTAGNPQKWVQVSYPVIYFMEAEAIDKTTGARVYVAMKVIYEGGANVVVVIAPNKASYQQQYAHPNDLNRMLSYNKFGVSKNDIIGTWHKTGGGGVEYYNAYTGNYAGMSAISSTDEFQFNSDDSYVSIHRAANTNTGSTTFSGLDYRGNYSVNTWELMATNRVGGKTKKFWCQLMAVRNGYILILTDSDYEPLKYVLYRKK